MAEIPNESPGFDADQLAAVDELISCWSNWELSRDYYLNVLIPRLVSAQSIVDGTAKETAALDRMRRVLGPRQWAHLAEVVRERQPLVSELRRDANEQLVEDARERRLTEKKAKAAEDETRREQLRAAEVARVQSIASEREAQRRAAKEAERILQAREGKIEGLLQALRVEFQLRYLEAQKWLSRHPDGNLVSDQEFRSEQSRFVAEWSRATLDMDLDGEQASAVAAVGGHFKVAARAGSGKTRTLVVRALFLQLHCNVPPDQIMLLAFNRDAAEQLQSRIASKLAGGQPPFCMTFHALAHGIVHPQEALLVDQGELNRAQSRVIQRCVDDLIRSPRYFLKFRKLMKSYYTEDWDRIRDRGDHLGAAAGVEFRRHLERETLNGEFVKSQGERLIANLLFEHGVSYKYEARHDWNGESYRPDFTVFVDGKSVAVIEYFGMEGSLKYDKLTRDKLEYWNRRPGVLFLPLYPKDLGDPTSKQLASYLMGALDKLDQNYGQLSDDELWSRVEPRAIDRFTETVRILIDRARQRRWNAKRLRAEFEGIAESDHARLFARLGAVVLERYEQHLVSSSEEDFTGLLWRGVDSIRAGSTRFHRRLANQEGELASLRHILIDEFQDFSEMFAELTKSMAKAAPAARIFAVGDDWQAINEFAGSDLAYFDSFVGEYEGATELAISTNYRSAREVVRRGNTVMAGFGSPAAPGSTVVGWVGLCDASTFNPTGYERKIYGSDLFTPLLVRLVYNLVADRKSVTLLTRRHNVWWTSSIAERKAIRTIDDYAAFIRTRVDNASGDLVTISTAHAFKGQESDVVIVLNADARNFPLIHPTLELFQGFGDSLESVLAAERRLFYVATTRAKERLLYLYDSASERSEFVSEMDRERLLTRLDPNGFQAVGPGTDIEIRVFVKSSDSQSVKDHGMTWNPRGGFWWTMVPASQLSPNSIPSQPWYQAVQRVEVRSDSDVLLEEYNSTEGPVAKPKF